MYKGVIILIYHLHDTVSISENNAIDIYIVHDFIKRINLEKTVYISTTTIFELDGEMYIYDGLYKHDDKNLYDLRIKLVKPKYRL